jgi:hypothetical protein
MDESVGAAPEGGEAEGPGQPAPGIDALYADAGGDGAPEGDDTPVSWLDVRAHEPVIAADGTQVGTVVEVAALAEEDIFHGIVFEHHARGAHLLAPASDVARITERAVHLSVDSGAAAAYEPFHPLHVKSLGLRGVFRWKHLGWKDAPE